MDLSAQSKNLLRRARAVRPINWAATEAVHAWLRHTGTQHDALVRHLPRRGHVCTRLPDGQWARFWSQGDDNIASRIYWREWHGIEPEQTLLFERLARRSRLTIDVGAHVGFYTIIAALSNPAGRVYAFEPLRATFERLTRNIGLNDLANVEAHNVAVGNEDGPVQLVHPITDHIPSSASLSRGFMETTGFGLIASTVRSVRVDTLIPETRYRECDLVKLDTETTEAAVLSGMSGILLAARPSIFCEVLPAVDASAITNLLAPMGYRFFLLTESGAQERDTVLPVDGWRNCLFVGERRTNQLADVL